jgi:hypothetical protein
MLLRELEKEIRELAIKRTMSERPNITRKDARKLPLAFAFHWDETPEGHEYWERLHLKWADETSI